MSKMEDFYDHQIYLQLVFVAYKVKTIFCSFCEDRPVDMLLLKHVPWVFGAQINMTVDISNKRGPFF